MDKGRREMVFTRYGEIYQTILRNIYPAKNSTGFPERNLSVNFSKAYEAVAEQNGEEAFSWFEFQFGETNNLHVDAVIINMTARELLVVEAKCFTNPAKKILEVCNDVVRINQFLLDLYRENRDGIYRIDMLEFDRIYGVILADIWTETSAKRAIVRSYVDGTINPESEGSFLNKYGIRSIGSLSYDVCNMKEVGLQQYNLLSFLWQEDQNDKT